MRSCKDFSELMSVELDQELTWKDRWSLKTHLMMCRSCARLSKQLRFLHEAAARLGGLPVDGQRPGAHLSEEARQRIRDAVAAAQGEGGAPTSADS